MQEEISRWTTLGIALAAGLIILLVNRRTVKERRSSGQWIILQLYKAMRFFWALVRAVDVGYLEYRRIQQEAELEIENERCLGKLVKASAPSKGNALEWKPAGQ
ncbi:MAG: hypothetical protein JO138_12885 [Acidobacteriaceae bacterium]|nr:hypothetical protein [Acidobacteriaceae bacterium]